MAAYFRKADTVILKSGKVYQNVKAYPRHGAHRISFQNGKEIFIQNQEIAKIHIHSVNWPKPKKAVLPKPAQEEPSLPSLPGLWENPDLGPLWKSLLLPGWGQYSLGHKWRGVAFFGTSALALNEYLQKRRLHTQAQEDYSEQLTPLLLSSQGVNGYLLFLANLEQEKSVLLRREKETNDRVVLVSRIV